MLGAKIILVYNPQDHPEGRIIFRYLWLLTGSGIAQSVW